MTLAFLAHPCRRLRDALPAAVFDDALVLAGDTATCPRDGYVHPIAGDVVHALSRRIRAYAGGDVTAAVLETAGRVSWATFAPPLVPTVTLLRLPPARTRPEPARPRLVLGQPDAPPTSPMSGLSILISERTLAGPASGYTLRVTARSPGLLTAALAVGRTVADATFLEASSLLDWPLLARHHRATVYTACTTLDHALVALAPPAQHVALRALLQTS